MVMSKYHIPLIRKVQDNENYREQGLELTHRITISNSYIHDMENITLTVKDDSKLSYLLNFLRQFDFVEVKRHGLEQEGVKSKHYDFFSSAGMWKNRKIDAVELRKKAWKRGN